MTTQESIHRFNNKQLSINYAQFRPNYPDEFIREMFNRVGSSGTDSIKVVDVGCGTGQLTVQMAQYCYENDIQYSIVAVDVSPTQIETANILLPDHLKPFVEYRVSTSGDIPVTEYQSVDLVTVAAALHWFDLEKFFAELKRIVRPGGQFVTLFYQVSDILSTHDANQLFRTLWYEQLKQYNAPQNLLNEGGFDTVQFPGPVERIRSVSKKNVAFSDYLSYVGTLSAVQKWRDAHKNEEDILVEYKKKMKDVLNVEHDQQEIEVSFPMNMIFTVIE